MEYNNPVCYVLGYGSLMYPDGINGRGLVHKYTWGDLSTCTLSGYKRGMFACYIGLLYYGVMKSHSSTVEGVLVPIFSKGDFEALVINEGAHDKYESTPHGKMYDVVDVTKSVCRFSYLTPAAMPIYVLSNRVDKSDKGRITPWYIANVWQGVLAAPWGYAFIGSLLRTGIMRPSKWQIKIAYLYNVLKFARRAVRR